MGYWFFESFSKRRTPTTDGMSCCDVCRRVLIFSWKVLKDRGHGHDIRVSQAMGGVNRRFKASGRCYGWQLEPCPYGLEPLYHFSLENSHPETRHQGVMFRSPQAFVGSMATLRYEPCTQFINVSQRALHIYFIDGCRVCPLDARYKNRTKSPLVWASSQIAVSVLTLHGS